MARFSAHAVRRTPEFRRVWGLPRRVLSERDGVAWAEALRPLIVCKGARVSPRWQQAIALAEIVKCRGGWLALPVGIGKTIITAVVGTLLDIGRVLIVTPGTLVGKTWADLESYHGKWRLPKHALHVMSSQSLGPESGWQKLIDFAPRVVVLDEADEFANPESSAALKLAAYRKLYPDAVFVALSGSPARTSILNYAHVMGWCLGEGCPLPLEPDELRTWAAALDLNPRDGWSPSPGPLGATKEEALRNVQRRIAETPGVIIIDGDSCDQPLTIRFRASLECRDLDAAFEKFLTLDENPGGVQVTDPLSRWSLDAWMGTGLYTYWDPPPPEPWRLARRAYAKAVRDGIRRSLHTDRPMYSEAQFVKRNRMHPAVRRWLEIKGTFKGKTKTAWISDSAIRACLAWLKEERKPGIIWTGSVEFGRALAARAGLMYYGPKGQCEGGGDLHSAPEHRSMVCSWNACKKGFNLQAWSRMLITHPPQSAKWLEQIFGREHRSDQLYPVTADILLGSGGTIDAFDRALEEAAWTRENVGLTQKILKAEIIRVQPKATRTNAFRWGSRALRKEEEAA